MTEGRTTTVDETEIGSYFVANYPPFSVWTADAVERDALPALTLDDGRSTMDDRHVPSPIARDAPGSN